MARTMRSSKVSLLDESIIYVSGVVFDGQVLMIAFTNYRY